MLPNSIRIASILTATLLAGACTPDPAKEVALSDFEAYWVVDSPLGETNRISPAVRFKVTSTGARKSIEAMSSFRRKSELQVEWGSDTTRVTQSGKPMAPGESRSVTLVSDRHYTGPADPEDLLRNAHFTDVHVLIFIRVGPSSWVKMAELDADRRIGTHALEGL